MKHNVRLALAVLIVLPILANILPLLGIVNADPRLLYSGLEHDVVPGFLHGLPYIDPSVAGIYEPAAREALRQWLSGSIPWWNHYEGIGVPLAGGLVPGAFSPFLPLLLVPNGILVQQIVAQIACGLLTFALLRLIGCAVFPALIGGALFALNGTFAWLGSIWCQPVVALPLSAIGLELLRRTSRHDTILGILCLALATYIAIVASFIETGFLDGVIAAAWFLTRLSQANVRGRAHYLALTVAAAAIGVMLAAPQLAAFLDSLKHGVSAHGSGLIGLGSLGGASIPQTALPYIWGPIFGYPPAEIGNLWGNVGGYIGIAPVLVASAVLAIRTERRLAFMLFGWIVLTIGAQVGLPLMVRLINFIPGVSYTAQYRYAPPSWEFALAILCGILLTEWTADRTPFLGRQHRIALAALGIALIASLAWQWKLLQELLQSPGAWVWPVGSVVVALLVCGVTLLQMLRSGGGARQVTGAVLVAEALLYYVIPTLSYPRQGALDQNVVAFLQANIGNSRLYSINAFPANYGTYYRIGLINHVDPLLPLIWTDYVKTDLDPYLVSPSQFVHWRIQPSPDQSSQEDVLAWNRRHFEGLSVKYVSEPPDQVYRNPSVYVTPSGSVTSGAYELGHHRLHLNVLAPEAATTIRSIGLLHASATTPADGILHVRACSGSECSTGAVPISSSKGNDFVEVPLGRTLKVATPNIRLDVYEDGWHHPDAVALFAQDTGFPEQLADGGIPLPGRAAKVRFTVQDDELPLRAYRDKVTSIFALPGAKPYMEAGKCTLQIVSRDEASAACPDATSSLVRRELYYPGWSVSIDGRPAQLMPARGIFQETALPKGASAVRFRYEPPYAGQALVLCAFSILLLAGGAGAILREQMRTARMKPV
jgi:hypothetical protein